MNEQVEKPLKILTIGESSVGKTCLILRYTNCNISSLPTLGVDFSNKYINIDGNNIKLQIWDTGGAEKFRAITKAYYRGSHGILVVFDISRRDTFNQTRMWIDSIQDAKNNHARIILIGNKCDLERDVTKEEAENLASQYKIRYIETSVKDNINVEEAFRLLATDVYNYFVIKNHNSQNSVSTTQSKYKKFCFK